MIRACTFLLLIFFLTGCAATTRQVQIDGHRAARAITCFRIDSSNAPAIDGVLDDECWQAVGCSASFSAMASYEPVPENFDTCVKVLHDSEYLYISFRGLKPDTYEPVINITEFDGPVWRDDSFEIAITDSRSDDTFVYQFIVNMAGVGMDVKHTRDTSLVSGYSSGLEWDGDWKAATAESDIAWTAEFAIAFENFNNPPPSGSYWRIQFGRHLVSHQKWYTWNLSRGQLIYPWFAGRIFFEDETISMKQ